jgi:hypothetical protein
MTEELIDLLLGIEDPKFAEEEQRNNPPPPKPFSIRAWGDIHTLKLPPRETFLGDVFALQTMQAIMGQGGVGKSRISLNIAYCNVLGREFCGLPTGNKPVKWLFIGNENSVSRWQRDIRAMSKGLTAAQLELLNTHIFLHCLEQPDDSFICLQDDSIKTKWTETIKVIRPDVLVADPWGEIQFGDPNNDLDTRQSIRELLKICTHINPKMGQVILHHARTGRANISQAAGWDKGNFGKGSKALYSGARAVINLAPGDAEDNSKLVMVCAKSNDAPPFEARGIKLVEDTMTYEIDIDFDLDAWQNDLEGKRQPGNSKGSIQDVVDGVGAGKTTYKELIKYLADKNQMASRTADKWIGKAIKSGYLRKRKNGDYVLSGKAKPRIPVEDTDNEDFI